VTDKPKHAGGRPKGSGAKPIDIEELQKWARAGATLPEMAQRLGVSLATLNRRLAEDDPSGEQGEWRRALEMAKGDLYVSLRSKQVAMALAGDRTMLIWLGKQYLGQKEKIEHGGTGVGGSIVVTDARDELKAKLDALSERLVDGKNSGPSNGLPN